MLRTRKTRKRAKGRTPRRPSKAATGRRTTQRRRPAKSRSTVGRVVYWGSVLGVWALIALGGVLGYVTLTMPADVMENIKQRPPNVTLVGKDGTVLAERGLRRGYIRLQHMPHHLVNAVLATEDRRFRGHFGVDPIGLTRAMFKNVQAGAIVEGGSTITQQLAKNLFLTPERTITRKMQEVVLAIWLEVYLSKDEILESYLNRVYFGAGTHGVEAAAKRYFGKSARQVTIAEAALLAGLLKAPSRYAPTRNPRLAEQRASIVIASMVDADLLTSAQAMAAISEPARVRNPSGITGYEYAADWVVDILPRLLGAKHRSDVIVETTIDPVLQRETQRIVSQTLKAHGKRVNAEQAAALVLDARGGVKAIVGGRSYRESQYNRVIRSRRQPGSAFKPFVYLAALESGLTPDTLVKDAPLNINGWRPRNYKNKYRGPITMREGLADSVNTVAVRLAMEAGRRRVVRTARRLGIESEIQKNLSIALGTSEVTLLELVSAYAPFANGGYIATPHIVNRIQTPKGKVLYQRRTTGRPRAVALPYVGAMNDMMGATMVSGTARSAALPDRPAAGKTGTTQNFRDAWFIGYTAHYVGGVWIGNDDGKPMKRVTGGTLPAGMWKNIMLTAHRDKRAAALPGGRAPALAHSRTPTDRQQQNKRSFFDRVLGVLSPNS